MKKLLVLIISVLSILVIYNIFKDDKIYYVSISDTNIIDRNRDYGYKEYIKDYLDELDILENYIDIYDKTARITDIVRFIKENKEYNDKTFQNILIKADIVTLRVGYNDIISKLDKYNTYAMYGYIDTFINDLESLFDILRAYDKEKIIFIGYFNPYGSYYDDIVDYINDKVKQLSSRYNIDFVDISDISKYLSLDNIDIEGQKNIFDRIRCIIDDKVGRK